MAEIPLVGEEFAGYRLLSVLASESLGLLNGLLSFLGEFVKPEWHLFYLSFSKQSSVR